MRSPVVALLAAAAMLLASTTTLADSKADAKRHFERALELVDEGAFEEATIEFKRAYDISPHHLVLYNLGQAYVGLGWPVEAVDTLRRYLREGGEKVTPGRRIQVEEEIKRQEARIARITIQVEPAGATITVDGKNVGRSPLGAPVRVGIGRHTILAEAEGHMSGESRLTVAGEQEATIELKLKPVAATATPTAAPPAKGTLTVTCSVPDVQVVVGKSVVGVTPLSEPVALAAGPHSVAFLRNGYAATPQSVVVAAGAGEEIDCKVRPIRPLPAAFAGQLEVVVSEPEAKISVDGSAFSGNGALPTGRHVVEVSRPGFAPWSQEVVLETGQPVRIEAELTPDAGYVAAQKEGAGAQRTWGYITGGAGVAVGLTAVGLYFWNDGRYGDWEDEQAALEDVYSQPQILNTDDAEQRQADNDDLLGSVQRMDGVVVGVGVVGGALLVTGVILLLTAEDPEEVALTVAPSPEGGFIGVGGAF